MLGSPGSLWCSGSASSTESAERLMRALWPLLWLLPTMAGMVAIAWRIAGREGAMVALLLALVGVPAYQQFTPGRIDHHNVMIALTLLAVAAIVWSDRKRWTAAAAGALSGLALAIGLESPAVSRGVRRRAGARYVLSRDAAPAVRDFGLALAGALALGFLADVGSTQWLVSRCDMLAINLLAAGGSAGLVLALAGHLNHEQMVTRGLAVLVAASLALVLFLAFEPRCIGGPFATVDPRIWPIWYVRELQPLPSVVRVNPLTAAGIAAFPAAALIAAGALIAQPALRRDVALLTLAAVFLVAVLIMVAAIRGYSYAMWFGMPLVAAAALRLFAAFEIRTLPGRPLPR